MRKAKMFIGVKPPEESNFSKYSYADCDEVPWVIYEDTQSSPKWWLYKIIATQPVHHKANYSLAYSPSEKRLTGKDLSVMARHRLSLLQQFLRKADLSGLKYYGSFFAFSIDEMLEKEN